MNRKVNILLLAVILVGASSASLSQAQADSNDSINTLDYFVSKHLDKGLTGSHNQDQVVEGSTSYYTKWDANAYEVHTWDDSYIYLREDHEWTYDQGYAFRPGQWMKRSMQIGESIVESSNLEYFFPYDSCDVTKVAPLPYTNTLESRITDYAIGGDLGPQDVIVLKYDYSTAQHPGNFERFYYSKEWGWVKWELYQQNSLIQTSIFNKITDKPIAPNKSLSCTRGGLAKGDADPVVYELPRFKLMTNKVVRTAASPALYYITKDNQREYICDPKLLSSYGVVPADIQFISTDDLKNYLPLTYVRSSSSEVYKLDGQQKRLVKPSAFKKNNIVLGDLPNVSPADIACYKTGLAIR